MWIALKNLARNPARALVAISMVFICMAALNGAMGYILAVFEGIRESSIREGTGHIQIARKRGFEPRYIYLLSFGLAPEDSELIASHLDSIDEVRFHFSRIEFQGLISSGLYTSTFSGKGIEAQAERRLSGSFVPVVAGEPLGLNGDERDTLLGSGLAEILQIDPLDGVTLLSTTELGAINGIDLTTRGIVRSGLPESDRHSLLAPLHEVQRLLVTKKVSRQIVVLKSHEDVEKTIAELKKRLPDYDFRTWRELTPIYDQVIALYRFQLGILAGFIAFIVIFSMASFIVVGILDRRSEIATLRAIGLPVSRVRRVFLVEAFVLVIFATGLANLICLIIFPIINDLAIPLPPPPGRSISYPLTLVFSPRAALMGTLALSSLAIVVAYLASFVTTRIDIATALKS